MPRTFQGYKFIILERGREIIAGHVHIHVGQEIYWRHVEEIIESVEVVEVDDGNFLLDVGEGAEVVEVMVRRAWLGVVVRGGNGATRHVGVGGTI